jgi:uncharacterized protein (UPF0276 family)
MHHLERIRRDYPVTLHGVGMSLGSTDPLDMEHLRRLKRLMGRIQPDWVSDHLCWTPVDGRHAHDLLRLPYVDGVVEHVAARINRVQDFLGQRILVENVSTYLGFRASTLAEIYPVCRALVGARFFQAVSTRYTLQTPSLSPDLDDYGADFARFLCGLGPAATLPYLPDVAHLE